VLYQTAAYGGQKHDGLFRAILVQSPDFPPVAPPNAPLYAVSHSALSSLLIFHFLNFVHKNRWQTFLAATNCSRPSVDDALACLRAAPVSSIVNANVVARCVCLFFAPRLSVFRFYNRSP
jgi:hypothetical protein